MVVIPVPTEGEIYIRYGSPGGVSIESLSAIVEPDTSGTPSVPSAPAAVAPVPASPSPTAVAPAPDLETIRQVIRDELRRAGVVREWGAVAPEADRVETLDEGSSVSGRTVTGEEGQGLRPRGFRAYTGLGLDDPNQFVLGGRLDLGPIIGRSRLLPELAVGFGDDATTVLAVANLHLPLVDPDSSSRWNPYVCGGLGLLIIDGGSESDTDLTVNIGLGMDARLGSWMPYVEYQGVRGFDLNRVLVGLRFGQ